ncbi:BCCT family transporter [Bacillaceae bacterium S4-13-58]
MKQPLNPVLWISATIVIIFTIWGGLFPNALDKQATNIYNLTTRAFGWLYLLSVMFFVVFCLFIAFSRYGKVRLGSDDSRPEFPFFTWIGMLFSAGFGVGLVFWGIAEPMSHFFSPPMGETALTPEAARLAMHYSFFHWGVHQWSVFTVVGLAIAYFQFRKKENGLVSTTFNPLIGKEGKTKLRNTIEILSVIATITGVATSLGMGILQINGGMRYVFGIPNNATVQIIITLILMALYLLSSTTGLNKGIKYLSNLNLGLALGLTLFMLFLGPTVFILKSFTLGLGDYLQHFIEFSFRLNPYTGGTWVRDWTIFYWAWAIAWSPFVGSFVARVSKGRTIREFVLGVLIIPPLIAIIWISVFGGSALQLDLFEGTQIAQAVNEDVTNALFSTFEYFPLTLPMSLLAILLIFTFLITSADSATYVLGMLTTNGSLFPSMGVKILWGTLMSAVAVVLIISSGLEGLQTASLISALPFTIILIFMCVSVYKSLGNERKIKKTHY